ncbi:uncharacterized protein G2W53_041082 [Senna tora]|uniref:Uncharacterized protein n=1 Tax=Senna tora TaxID=362788 RepID=A0A834SF56_9FABA|nr:uncharacterized protein G2W53_041082 [Senna tora]
MLGRRSDLHDLHPMGQLCDNSISGSPSSLIWVRRCITYGLETHVPSGTS